MRDTNALIDHLSAEGGGVGNAVSPYRLFAGGASALVGYIILVFAVGALSLRPDLVVALTRPLFAAEIISLVLLIMGSVFAAAMLAYPDKYQHPRIIYLPVAAFIVFVLILAAAWMMRDPNMVFAHEGLKCLTCIIGLSMLPAALLFYRMRHMATVAPDRAGLLCALCAFAVGALILRLSEPTDMISHVVIWHYLPMLGVSFIGFCVGPRLLRW